MSETPQPVFAEETLEAITCFCEDRGFSPTIRELADLLGISPTAVHWRIRVLAKQGRLTYEGRTPRTIRVLNPREDS